MILHKKFLMLYLSGVEVQCRWIKGSSKWISFDVTDNALDVFTYEDYEFRIKPDDDEVVAVDSKIRPLNNIDCEVAML